jgi:hypothetical protein
MRLRFAHVVGAFPVIGRLFCLLGYHVCDDSNKLFATSNPDYFKCRCCHKTIEVYR